jgi:uncharacterized protein
MRRRALRRVWAGLAAIAPLLAHAAVEGPHRLPLTLRPDDVLATGNEWIALPEIRASDGALVSFNTLFMRERGLLQPNGEAGRPVLEPYLQIGSGKKQPLEGLSWSLLEYWIPQAKADLNGLEVTVTYCAPPGHRAAFLRLTLANHRAEPVAATLGLKSSFGSLSRVTYVPVVLRGERTLAPTPWVDPGEAYSYITYDTRFSWAIVHPGSKATLSMPPVVVAPEADATRTVTLQPGESTEALYVLSVGLEEFSAAHNARALKEELERNGSDAVIAKAAAWCRARTRTTGRADLDALMNRNLLFTALYAWGRTLDTEELVGVTSRSPRYYVSAAYWDRDAMLWSFPGVLDSDPQFARQVLEYALGIQLRNTGTHSRFIDGVVLEDGFQLDESVAPIVALASYVRATNDTRFVEQHRDAVTTLRDRLVGRFDPETGMYSSLQDSQDEFQKLPFLTYDNALAWRALRDLGELYDRLHDGGAAADARRRAAALREAVLKHAVVDAPPGGGGSILGSATDGKEHVTTDIPPGSLLKLPILGFLAEEDPLFKRTFEWLHSAKYRYSYSDRRYGLPGSYRLPFTTSWTIADELLLKRSHDKAVEILLASPWDAGIITEGIDPDTAIPDKPGRAFATAAGYVAHAICATACLPRH